MAVKFASKEDVVIQVKILDIAKEFNIEVEKAYSGKFNYRCRCPWSEHKHGSERTPSLYIDSVKNNYYCFGCQSSSNCIDFYMICADVSFSEAISILKLRVDKTKSSHVEEISIDNISYILEISALFRKTMLSNPNDLKWISGLMKRTDVYLDKVKSDDVEKVKELFSKINQKIKERYHK